LVPFPERIVIPFETVQLYDEIPKAGAVEYVTIDEGHTSIGPETLLAPVVALYFSRAVKP
jgi:hypothetical protein